MNRFDKDESGRWQVRGDQPPGRFPYPTSTTISRTETFIEDLLESEGWTPEAFDRYAEDMKFMYREWYDAWEREEAERVREEARERERKRIEATLKALAGKKG